MEDSVEIDELDIDERRLTFRVVWSSLRKNYLNINVVKRRFPFVKWLRGYELDEFKGDLIAGLSVSVALLRQAIGTAAIANLPITYGLYSSIFGSFVYAVLGSCKDISIGPTPVQSMFTEYYAQGDAQYASLLAFMSGVVQITIGILGLDWILDFVPFPVISVYLNAACVTIILSQLSGFFGIPKVLKDPPIAIYDFYVFVTNLDKMKVLDTLLGTLCFLFIWTLKISGDYAITPNAALVTEEDKNGNKVSKTRFVVEELKKMPKRNEMGHFKAFLMWLSFSRTLLTMIICTTVAYCFRDSQPFTLMTSVKPGIPLFEHPKFRRNVTEITDGKIIHRVMYFSEILHELTPGWIVMPFIGALTAITTARALSEINQIPAPTRLTKNTIHVRHFDPSQEILTLGVTNFLGSFVRAFPVGVSLSRSMIAHTSGVRTQFNNVIVGFVVVIALSPQVSQAFHYIPRTTLSSVIICSVALLLKPKDFIAVYRTSFVDFILYIVTFISSLVLGLGNGVIIGVIFYLILLLAKVQRPQIECLLMYTPFEESSQISGLPYLIVKPTQSVHFPSIYYFTDKTLKSTRDFLSHSKFSDNFRRESKLYFTRLTVVIDGEHLFHSDSTFIKEITNFVLTLKQRGIKTVFYRVRYPIRKRLLPSLTSKEIIFNHCRNLHELIRFINAAFSFASPFRYRNVSLLQTSL